MRDTRTATTLTHTLFALAALVLVLLPTATAKVSTDVVDDASGSGCVHEPRSVYDQSHELLSDLRSLAAAMDDVYAKLEKVAPADSVTNDLGELKQNIEGVKRAADVLPSSYSAGFDELASGGSFVNLTQYETLLLFYGATGGKGWTYSSSGGGVPWLSTPNECEWDYVTCDGENNTGSVISLLFPPQVGLVGFLPSLVTLHKLQVLALPDEQLDADTLDWVCELKYLTVLNLYSNSFTCRLPDCFTSESSLAYLALYDNNIHGPIPPSLGSLSGLTHLLLEDNELEGTIPAIFGQFEDLQVIEIGYNPLLTGSIDHIGMENLTELQYVSFPGNAHVGPCPNLSASNASLEFIELNDNTLDGFLPEWLCCLVNTFNINLAFNKFSGPLPQCCDCAGKLETLLLNNNWLSGSIPDNYFMLPYINTLDLSSNLLTGWIPGVVEGTLPVYMEVLNLQNNLLNGQLPPSFDKLGGLRTLDASNNSLTGTLPPLPNTALNTLDLAYNFISGGLAAMPNSTLTTLTLTNNLLNCTLPEWVASWNNLQSLHVNDNHFYGSLPESLADLNQLTELDLSSNDFEGTVPHGLSRMSNLRVLSLCTNKLTGQIPYDLSSLPLTLLDLHDNYFSGTIDPNLGYFSDLVTMDLSINNLIGEIPTSLGAMPTLSVLSLADNSLEGGIPEALFDHEECYLSMFDASNNARLSGSVPSSVGGCKNLTEFEVSYCNFTGSIPPALNEAESLQLLSVAHNRLSGHIPDLSGLHQLETLEVYSNALTGSLPETLNHHKLLRYIDVSDNQLTGTIPEMNDLPSLAVLNLFLNSFEGEISTLNSVPSLIEIRMASNFFSPNFNFSSLTSLEILDISSNGLKCPIAQILAQLQINTYNPSSLEYTSRLRELNLAFNELSGTIPISINNLTAAISIDLSNNQLSGGFYALSQVGRALTSVGIGNNNIAWQFLLLSNNNFEGSIDELGSLRDLILVSLDGNPKLRASNVGALPTFLTPTAVWRQELNSKFQCPQLTGTTRNMFVDLDPSYYSYVLCECGTGYYGKDGVCQKCPDGCECVGHRVSGCYPTTVGDKPHKNGTKIVKKVDLISCPRLNGWTACNPKMLPKFECAKGYHGTMCYMCERNYYPVSTFLCLPESNANTIAYVIIYTLFHIANLLAIVHLPFSSRYRILISFLQFLTTLQIPIMPWPVEFTTTLFTLTSIVTFNPFAVMHFPSVDSRWFASHLFWIVQIPFSLFLLEFSWMLSGIAAKHLNCCKPKEMATADPFLMRTVSRTQAESDDELLELKRSKTRGRTLVILLVQVYMGVTVYALRVVRLWKWPHKTLLRDFPAIEASSGNGKALLGTGWTLIIFVTLGFPVAGIIAAYRFSLRYTGVSESFVGWLRRLWWDGLDEGLEIGSEADPLPEPRDMGLGPMGVVANVYRNHAWYAELVICLRRVALSVFYTFVPSVPDSGLLVCISLALVVFLVIQSTWAPFKDRLDNILDGALLSIMTIVAVIGLYTNAATELGENVVAVGYFSVVLIVIGITAACMMFGLEVVDTVAPRRMRVGGGGGGNRPSHHDLSHSITDYSKLGSEEAWLLGGSGSGSGSGSGYGRVGGVDGGMMSGSAYGRLQGSGGSSGVGINGNRVASGGGGVNGVSGLSGVKGGSSSVSGGGGGDGASLESGSGIGGLNLSFRGAMVGSDGDEEVEGQPTQYWNTPTIEGFGTNFHSGASSNNESFLNTSSNNSVSSINRDSAPTDVVTQDSV